MEMRYDRGWTRAEGHPARAAEPRLGRDRAASGTTYGSGVVAMRPPRRRVPAAGFAACALAAAFVTGIVLLVKDPRTHHIPQVRSVSITAVQQWSSSPPSPTSFGRATAQALAGRLNALPHQSGEIACGADTGMAYMLRFITRGGGMLTARVSIGGCLGVDVRANGRWWGWQKWDPDDTAKVLIRRDLGLHA